MAFPLFQHPLIEEVKACQICAKFLPLGPKPIFVVNPEARILIIGQAPGTKVHATGIPWNDPSGDQLRRWLGVDRDTFYDPSIFGIVPMGFCYPGKGKGGDLPPRPECAPTWHAKLLELMPNLQLTLLIGQYAQKYYLENVRKGSLTETVRAFESYLPRYIPLVHPSPRNKRWQKNNPWFEDKVVPILQFEVGKILQSVHEP